MKIRSAAPALASSHAVSVLVGLLALVSIEVGASEFEDLVVPFLETHCFECHDDLSSKGDLDLSSFFTDDDVMADREIWASVYEKIESHQMPPPKEGTQPTDAERAALLAWIEDIAARPDAVLGERDPGKPVLRRLTRLEYNNTVRDLFELDLDVFIFPERLKFSDRSYFEPEKGSLGRQVKVPMREYGGKYRVLVPQAGLPGDNRAAHGFRNRGEAMDFSPLLLEKYVQVAADISRSEELPIRSRKYAELLGLDTAQLPQLSDRSPRPPGYNDAPIVPLASVFAPDIENAKKPEDAPDWISGFREELAAAAREGRGGVFDLPALLGGSVIAGKGGLLKAQFGDRIVTVNPNEDLWLVDFGTADESSQPILMANKNRGEKAHELTFEIRSADEDEGIARLGVCVLGRRGQSGPVTLTAKFTDGTETAITAQIEEGPGGTTFFSFAAIPGEHIQRLHVDGSEFSGDYVLIDDIGFLTDGDPQSAELVARRAEEVNEAARNHGTEPEKKEEAQSVPAPAQTGKREPRERLASFVAEAFRRPVEKQEVDRFFGLFESARAAGSDEPEAMKVAVQAILASPGFLFHEMDGGPGTDGAVAPLGDFELANRLSYFLWSSLPDAELLAAAESGKLASDSGELERQARRMLRDPRAKELSESFATQWLRLDQLYTAKPDRDLFGAFYSGPQGKTTLHATALVEPLLLFETVMVEDRSILEFIDPGYSWLNRQLADLYGIGDSTRRQIAAITGVNEEDGAEEEADSGTREVRRKRDGEGSEWFRIELPDASRGGFLAMSGPLTVTSLPFRTSPVKRGAWILETLFNRPPTEPKEAFAIENDTREAAQAMSIREKFEDHRSQAACYSCHIRLDPPGFAMESFDPIGAWRETDGGTPVDAGGEWNGVEFEGPAAFKRLIAEEPNEFTRGFIEHLLSYALSRKLGLYDMPAVAEIQEAAEADDWKFATVVAEVVKSYPFTHVRSSKPGASMAARED